MKKWLLLILVIIGAGILLSLNFLFRYDISWPVWGSSGVPTDCRASPKNNPVEGQWAQEFIINITGCISDPVCKVTNIVCPSTIVWRGIKYNIDGCVVGIMHYSDKYCTDGKFISANPVKFIWSERWKNWLEPRGFPTSTDLGHVADGTSGMVFLQPVCCTMKEADYPTFPSSFIHSCPVNLGYSSDETKVDMTMNCIVPTTTTISECNTDYECLQYFPDLPLKCVDHQCVWSGTTTIPSGGVSGTLDLIIKGLLELIGVS